MPFRALEVRNRNLGFRFNTLLAAAKAHLRSQKGCLLPFASKAPPLSLQFMLQPRNSCRMGGQLLKRPQERLIKRILMAILRDVHISFPEPGAKDTMS